MKNRILILAISLFIGLGVSAQEYLKGFSYNTKKVDEQKTRETSNTLTLPFFDDFSEVNTYPDATKWQNRSVLINSGFPLFPTNYNAATFDALDETGKVYPHASSSPFVADSLISNPIKLNDLTPADSLYFSFYYQPQGNGDAPEETDSLVLMFGFVLDTFKIEYDTILVKDMLSYMQLDTISIGDILYHDMNSSCDQDMYAISENQYTIAATELGPYRRCPRLA